MEGNKELSRTEVLPGQWGYSEVNGIQMYYELYGDGKPLVLIHGGGSTIQTTFGRVIPLLARNRRLICMELQAHGRTGDRDCAISFEQDADDVAGLLRNLGVAKADVLGFSNGGNTALMLGIRHPAICGKIVAASVLLKRSGAFEGFWAFMEKGTFEQMPQAYKDAFLAVCADEGRLMNLYRKCADRMIGFQDFGDADLRGISVPVLFINGDRDVGTSEHIVAMSRLVSGSRLAILPGGHGEYMGEITTLRADGQDHYFMVPLIEQFLVG